MKQKLLALSILFFVFISAASAQTGKGAFYLGGSVSYDYSSFGSTSTYNFNNGYTDYTTTKIAALSIRPEIGFFISNKWSIGVQAVYSRTSGTETSKYYSYTNSADNYVSSDKYHDDIAGIGVHARYYCMITDKFGFFPELGISTLNNTTYFKYGTLSIGSTPNFVFFPTPKLGVNLGFGGLAYNLDYQTKDSTFHLGLNDNISFGLNYYWGRK